MAKVLVVGAGPAGASLAYLLSRRGIDVTLVERQRDFEREFRGEVLLPSGVDALRQMGLEGALRAAPHAAPDSITVYMNHRQVLRVALDPAWFGGADPGFNYAPKCLKTTAGATITFEGDFVMHPLRGSAIRGTTTGNPIPTTPISTGSSMPFTFPTSGFYAYYCAFHGADDSDFMNGVIWVN